MPGIAYTVYATLPDQGAAAEYVAWLLAGHTDAVIAGGAASAQVIRIVDPATPVQVETRYLFSTRADFDRYVRETAPGLRAEGLARFGPASGVSFRRTVGVVQA